MKEKIKQLQNSIDISKKYPGYINKKIFWVGFILFLLFIGFIILSYGFNDFVYIECNNIVCNNPYIECSNKIFKTPECEFFINNDCKGNNCNNTVIFKGEYIGEKPPIILKNAGLISFIILILTFLVNHLLFWVKK